MASQEVTDQKLEAQLRETDAQLSMLQAQADARRAKGEMDEISGLRAARDRAGQQIANLKQQGAQSIDKARRDASGALHELQVRIEEANERYGAWDAARERRFQARVAEGEDQLQVWNAQTDVHQAQGEAQYEGERAALKQQVDTAKTTFKQWKASATQETQDALAKASRQLDKTLASIKQKFSS
jgi:hypothetical protein